MEKTRHNERIVIMTALYQIEIYKEKKLEYNIREIIEEQELQTDFINETIEKIIENQEYLDKKINKHLKNWNIKRLGKTDAAILRLGAYEILYTQTPAPVIINESVNLAKKYSDDKVVGMINSVLDQIFHEKE